MKDNKVRLMCIASIFMALVFIFTAFLQIPVNNGYIHIGDSLIYISACLLPFPYAIAVSAGGALLADCLTRFAFWAPGSIIIKSLTVLLFSRKKNIINIHNLLALIPAAILCAGGYYLYEALINSNYIAPLAGIPSSIVQSTASSIIFVMLGYTLDKINFKSKINGGNNK